MQSFMDTAAPPLSPSSFFNFDNEMSNQGLLDDGVDLFRYYMDMQAFQGKESSSYNNGAAGAGTGLGSMMNNNTMMDSDNNLSPYNAFFNPNAYSRSSPSASTSSSTPSLSTISQPSITAEQQEQHRSAGDSSSSSNTLFPFAEASSSTQSSYDTVNPSSILSFDHLAGSENPQPIDPHLLMGGGSSTQSVLPTVKEEEDIETSSSFPLSNTATFPLTTTSNITSQASSLPINNATITSSLNQSRRSASAVSHFDDSMNGIDGESEEEESDDDQSEEEEEELPKSRKRGAASTAPTKKRTSATKSSSSNKKQSKKETSIFSSSSQQQAITHPHALVPVPEYEDRPSKAEYDKLSSKEKRQMRNKISARNFRHRRKAHIDTLEALVQDKENVIAVLSEEVGTLRTENQGLRADIEVLKKNWESIAAKIGAASASTSSSAPLTPSSSSRQHHLSPDEDDLYGAPGSLPALSPAASSSAESTNGDHLSELSFEQARGLAQGQAQASQARPSTSSSSSASAKGRVTRSSNIQRPNLRKDLGPSGTSFSGAFGAGNRSMNVHTTLIPELNFNFPVPPPSMFSSSSTNSLATTTTAPPSNNGSSLSSSGRTSPPPPSSTGSIGDLLAGKRERDANSSNANARLNMNPALNGLTPDQIANLREQFFNANSTMLPSSMHQEEENKASLVSGKISRAGQSATLDPLQNSFFDSNPFISLRQDSLQDYRAQLYAKLANNVAGIHQAQSQQQQSSNNKNSNNNNGMNGLRPAFFANSPLGNNAIMVDEKEAEVVKIASIAQKTLFDKLSTAFWDAFAGNNTTSPKGLIPSTSIERKRRSSSSSSASASSNGNNNEVDGQKIADLLAGRSKLQIVSNEEKGDKVDSLARQIETMGLKK